MFFLSHRLRLSASGSPTLLPSLPPSPSHTLFSTSHRRQRSLGPSEPGRGWGYQRGFVFVCVMEELRQEKTTMKALCSDPAATPAFNPNKSSHILLHFLCHFINRRDFYIHCSPIVSDMLLYLLKKTNPQLKAATNQYFSSTVGKISHKK